MHGCTSKLTYSNRSGQFSSPTISSLFENCISALHWFHPHVMSKVLLDCHHHTPQTSVRPPCLQPLFLFLSPFRRSCPLSLQHLLQICEAGQHAMPRDQRFSHSGGHTLLCWTLLTCWRWAHSFWALSHLVVFTVIQWRSIEGVIQ